MERFMLILREDMQKVSKLTHEERFKNIPEMLEWIKNIAESGNYVKGEPLAMTGRYVTKNEVRSDGPFIESKEGICGYDIILAENINQAVAIAQTCPMVMKGLGIREVRQLISLD